MYSKQYDEQAYNIQVAYCVWYALFPSLFIFDVVMVVHSFPVKNKFNGNFILDFDAVGLTVIKVPSLQA